MLDESLLFSIALDEAKKRSNSMEEDEDDLSSSEVTQFKCTGIASERTSESMRDFVFEALLLIYLLWVERAMAK